MYLETVAMDCHTTARKPTAKSICWRPAVVRAPGAWQPPRVFVRRPAALNPTPEHLPSGAPLPEHLPSRAPPSPESDTPPPPRASLPKRRSAPPLREHSSPEVAGCSHQASTVEEKNGGCCQTVGFCRLLQFYLFRKPTCYKSS